MVTEWLVGNGQWNGSEKWSTVTVRYSEPLSTINWLFKQKSLESNGVDILI